MRLSYLHGLSREGILPHRSLGGGRDARLVGRIRHLECSVCFRLKLHDRYNELCKSLLDCSQEKRDLQCRLKTLSASALSSCSSLADDGATAPSSAGSSLNELAIRPTLHGHLGGFSELRQRCDSPPFDFFAVFSSIVVVSSI